MRIKLKRKPQKVSLKKNKPDLNIDEYHATLDKNLKLAEERNKKLPKVETGKWYHYKNRLPPNDFESYVVVLRDGYDSYQVMSSAVMLQHYISEMCCYERDSFYTEWLLLPK